MGEALCPERFSAEELRAKRDSSDEGGLLFSALYQQEPMPQDGAIFKASQMGSWRGVGGGIEFANTVIPRRDLKLWFATIDPALKSGERNDPTGFLIWAIAAPGGELLMMEDHTGAIPGRPISITADALVSWGGR